MKTSLTKLEGLKRSLTVELPVEAFNQKNRQDYSKPFSDSED